LLCFVLKFKHPCYECSGPAFIHLSAWHNHLTTPCIISLAFSQVKPSLHLWANPAQSRYVYAFINLWTWLEMCNRNLWLWVTGGLFQDSGKPLKPHRVGGTSVPPGLSCASIPNFPLLFFSETPLTPWCVLTCGAEGGGGWEAAFPFISRIQYCSSCFPVVGWAQPPLSGKFCCSASLAQSLREGCSWFVT
jgi:hypothetical protein